MNPNRSILRGTRSAPAFTLVELLVVIAIIAVLAALSFVGVGKFTEKGRKVQALAQFRDLEVGMKAYETENNRPLLPPQERSAGRDTVFGDPGGNNSNDFIVAVLNGGEPTQWRRTELSAMREVNPREQTYLQLPYSPKNVNGVGKDGVLYDPWGRELMIAVNGFKGPSNNSPMQEESGGSNDRILETYRVGEYQDTRPREQSFVFWTFGGDGKKGKEGLTKTAIVPFAGSDDVISWQ